MRKGGKLRARHFVFDKSESQKEIPRGLAGCAFKYEFEDMYRLRLNIFDGRELYIVPNRDRRSDGPQYWVLSRRKVPKNGFQAKTYFQVGYGTEGNGSIQSIDIHIYDLNRTYELCLEPEDYHYRMKNCA